MGETARLASSCTGRPRRAAASEGISLAVSLTHSHELAAAVVVREPAA